MISRKLSILGRIKPWQQTALVCIAFALLVGLMTWPAIISLDEWLIGNDEDVWVFYWNNWWFREVLLEGLDLFSTELLFYPLQTSLVAHSSSFTTSFLSFLLHPLVGPVASYNLVLMLGLWIGAVGMYLLVYDITGHRVASFFAGFVFAFSPYHFSRVLAHANLGAIHWWPFYILFFRRAILTGRRRDAFVAGVFAAITFYSGLHLAVFLALWTLVYIGWQLWRQRQRILRERETFYQIISRSGLVLLTTILLCLPLLVLLALNWSELAEVSSTFDESMYKQSDLAAYLVPPPQNPLWGRLVHNLYDNFLHHYRFNPYIGFAAIGLTIAAVWGWRKKAGFWLLSAGLWILLAAGPVLRINGLLYDQLPLPYRWLGTLFPISTIRVPHRFNLLLVLSIAVLVGMGTAYLARHRLWKWVLIPLGLILVLEYLIIPIPSMKLLHVSPYIEEMAEDDAAYGIVDYPLDYSLSKRWLYFQTLHGKPSVEGHVSRYSEENYEFIANDPILNNLYDGALVGLFLPRQFFEDQRINPQAALGPDLNVLLESGVRYILFHRGFANEERVSHFESVLPLTPMYEDDALMVFDLAHPRLRRIPPFPIPLSPEIDLVQVVTHIDPAQEAIEFDLDSQLNDSNVGEPTCQLVLGDNESTTLFKPFANDIVWQAGDLARQSIDLPIPPNLPDEHYRWKIICPDEKSYTGRESLYVVDGNPSLLMDELDLRFDNSIALAGYRWWIQEDTLVLELYWQAVDEIGQDYKVFVHLIDKNDSIVRQYDAFPCNWNCPTSQWSVGEIITDEARMSITGLPAGDYRFALGMYDEATGERLEIRDINNQTFPDDYFIIDTTVSMPDDK
jgi:hypothetical protein